MDLTGILQQKEINRHELLASLYYPGNEKVAQKIFNTKRYDAIFHEPLPQNIVVALNEAKVASDKNDYKRFDKMLEKALEFLVDEDSISDTIYLKSGIEGINKHPEVIKNLLEKIISRNQKELTESAIEIAEIMEDQEQVKRFIELYLSQGGYTFSAIHHYENLGDKEKVRELRVKELNGLRSKKDSYSVDYAKEHFPQIAKTIALEIVNHDGFMKEEDKHRWKLYQFLEKDVPEKLLNDKQKIKTRVSKQLKKDIKKFKSRDYPTEDFFRKLVGLDEQDLQYKGLASNQQLKSLYKKRVSSTLKERPDEIAKTAFEGYQRTKDMALLEVALGSYIKSNNYQKVLECAKVLKDKDRVKIYGTIVKMLGEKET